VSLFITLEGTEGCGKSTQAARLARHLREVEQRDVVLTREPGGTPTTERIRTLLADPQCVLEPSAELLLFLADRAQHVATVIRPALERGAVVVCDRYADSTTAYQGYGRGHDLARLADLNDWASGRLRPGLTLWLDCDVANALGRATKKTGGPGDRFESEPLAFHDRVRHGFAQLAERNPERIVRIDGDRDIEHVFADVLSVVSARLP
jgi:dTMP kinase